MQNKNKLLLLSSMIIISLNTNASNSDIKYQAPSQYDCSVSETELYMAKRTNHLMKKSSIMPWEKFKKVAAAAKRSSVERAKQNKTGNPATDAKNLELAKTGGGDEKDNAEDCGILTADFEDFEFPSGIGDSFNDALDLLTGDPLASLQKLAEKKANEMAENLISAVKDGFCSRMSPEYLGGLLKDNVSKVMKKELGYSLNESTKDDFLNKVVGDQLKDEFGTSNARLLNVMDEDLDDNRKRYMENYTKKQLNSAEKKYIDH